MTLTWVTEGQVPKKLVRSSAAKDAHARVRRKRMAEYQQEQQKTAGLRGQDLEVHFDVSGSNTNAEVPSSMKRDINSPAETTSTDDAGSVSLPQCPSPAWFLHQQSPRPSSGPGCFRDPFNNLAIPLNRNEKFLLHHYINTVIGVDCCPIGTFQDPPPPVYPPLSSTIPTTPNSFFQATYPYQNAILTSWLPAALADPGMLTALFVCACRSLHMRTGEPRYFGLALQYKIAALRTLARGVAWVEASRREGWATNGSLLIGPDGDDAAGVQKRCCPGRLCCGGKGGDDGSGTGGGRSDYGRQEDAIISTALQLASDELVMSKSSKPRRRRRKNSTDDNETENRQQAQSNPDQEEEDDGYDGGPAWRTHISAVLRMVEHQGGLANVHGMDGFLRQMIAAVAGLGEPWWELYANNERGKGEGVYTTLGVIFNFKVLKNLNCEGLGR